MLTEEGEKDFRKAIVCLYWPQASPPWPHICVAWLNLQGVAMRVRESVGENSLKFGIEEAERSVDNQII